MTTERHELSNADVWTLVESGCNTTEIAEYAGVSHLTAYAMVLHATSAYAKAAA
jgi:hypothetical protein